MFNKLFDIYIYISLCELSSCTHHHQNSGIMQDYICIAKIFIFYIVIFWRNVIDLSPFTKVQIVWIVIKHAIVRQIEQFPVLILLLT